MPKPSKTVVGEYCNAGLHFLYSEDDIYQHIDKKGITRRWCKRCRRKRYQKYKIEKTPYLTRSELTKIKFIVEVYRRQQVAAAGRLWEKGMMEAREDLLQEVEGLDFLLEKLKYVDPNS